MQALSLLTLAALWGALAPAAAQIASARPQPTFSRDVAPILQKRCQVCHRPGTFAPMSLLTYEETRPWARAIKEKVVLREMPPWHIDKNVGVRHFSNDVSLSDAEINAITNWVDGGAARGNPADLPPPRQFAEADQWQIGKPDVFVTLPQDLIAPAKAADRWIDIVVDPGFTEDRYIQAIETKPTKGFRVVHHVVTAVRHDDAGDVVSTQGTFLNEYALGKNADVFPEGAGRLLKAGSKINFNVHLHSIGEETAVNVALAIKFHPKPYVPKYVQITQRIGVTTDLDIPPNTDNVRTDSYTTLTRPARILSFQPHMHNRGKAQCIEAIYPGGNRVEMLSCVSRYQFAWHLVYLYDEDHQPLLPAGTTLHVISWHNNTTSNRFNPDPDALVTFGQRTIDEMGFSWVNYYYLSEEDFQRQVESRRTKRGNVRASAR